MDKRELFTAGIFLIGFLSLLLVSFSAMLSPIRENMDRVETGLNACMDRVEAGVNARMDKLEAELKADLRELRVWLINQQRKPASKSLGL